MQTVAFSLLTDFSLVLLQLVQVAQVVSQRTAVSPSAIPRVWRTNQEMGLQLQRELNREGEGV